MSLNRRNRRARWIDDFPTMEIERIVAELRMACRAHANSPKTSAFARNNGRLLCVIAKRRSGALREPPMPIPSL